MARQKSQNQTVDETANGSDSVAIEALSELASDANQAGDENKQAKAKAPGGAAGRKPGVITGDKLVERLDRGAAKWIYIEQAKYVRGLMATGMSREEATARIQAYNEQHINGVLDHFHEDSKMESAGATYFGKLAPAKGKPEVSDAAGPAETTEDADAVEAAEGEGEGEEAGVDVEGVEETELFPEPSEE